MFRSTQTIGRAAIRHAQTSRRGYANAAGGGGGGNLPLILGGLGIAGLGGYVYMDRTASGQAKGALNSPIAAAKANANELADNVKDKAEQIGQQARGVAENPVQAAKANANELAANVGDKAREVKDNVKGPFTDEPKAFGQKDAAVVTALIKDKWVDLTLTDVKKYNHDTNIYTFEFPDKDLIAGGKVAWALLTKSSDPEALRDDKGKPVIRPYTPISSSDQKGELQLMVKTYPDGKMSQHIAHLNKGDKLAFKGPIQKIEYKPNEFGHGICIGGGSGITPMCQLISTSLNNPEDKTKWTLFYANKTEQDILLREQWDKLVKEHPDRFKVVYTLDKPGYFWKGEKGFVSKEMIQKYVPTVEDTKWLLSGPPPQVASLAGPKDGSKQGELKGVLAEMGANASQVFKF